VWSRVQKLEWKRILQVLVLEKEKLKKFDGYSEKK